MEKIAVVTGATKGIGRELALKLMDNNYKVINASRNRPAHTDTDYVKLDVRNKEECGNAVKKIVEKYGKIDLWVNNAGVLYFDTMNELDTDKMKNMFETNVFGTSYCSHYVVQEMKKNGGIIVNIASTSGISFRGDVVTYSASKWAVVGLTGGMRKELQDTKIDVICFCPGGTNTDLFRHGMKWDMSGFLDPRDVAENIFKSINRKDKSKWFFIFRRDREELEEYAFEEYPLPK